MKRIWLTAIIIIMALTGPLFSQNITVDQNDVTITIRIQVEGLISGADTVFVSLPPDTVLVKADTVFVPEIEYITLPQDTTYITRIDTLYIPRIDTLYVTRIDTIKTTTYDTLYYPVHPVVDIGFSDTPPEWRRVDRVILRPVGWAAGTVALKGSDDPYWTDIAIEVSTGDMWGTGDYFMYVNIPTTEWTYAAAMLDSLVVMDRRARTGLQIRQSYEPGSPFIMLAYQDGRASINQRAEWGGEVFGHPDGSFEVPLPIVLQVNMTSEGFDARLHDVWTDSVLKTWSLPNFFEGKFYTGIATTSWRTDYITRAYYSMLNILDAVPWNQTCRDGDGNLTDCPEDM